MRRANGREHNWRRIGRIFPKLDERFAALDPSALGSPGSSVGWIVS